MAPAGKVVFITGGARSGKSSFAERYAGGSGKEVVYVATSPVVDEETRERIRAHRSRRPQEWITVEEPLLLEKILREHGSSGRVLLVDCLSLWVTNHLLDRAGIDGDRLYSAHDASRISEELLGYFESVATLTRNTEADVIVVSNEVGMGLVPDNRLSRVYRDLAGKVNQLFAGVADEVYILLAGIPLRLR